MNLPIQLLDAGGEGKVVYSTAKWSAKVKDKNGTTKDVGSLAAHVFERQQNGPLRLRLHKFN